MKPYLERIAQWKQLLNPEAKTHAVVRQHLTAISRGELPIEEGIAEMIRALCRESGAEQVVEAREFWSKALLKHARNIPCVQIGLNAMRPGNLTEREALCFIIDGLSTALKRFEDGELARLLNAHDAQPLNPPHQIGPPPMCLDYERAKELGCHDDEPCDAVA